MQDIDKVFGDDYECEGQISIFDFMDDKEPTPMIAVSKVFARAIKQMNLLEWKTFVYALTNIRWNDTNKRKVHLNKWSLVERLGLKSDENHISGDLKRAIGDLWKHSSLEFNAKDGSWENGCFITRVRVYRDYVLIVFEEDYMALFEELDKEKNYITLWSEDLFKMTSERSILFYESLRLHSDTRKTNTRIYGVKDLKTLFDIPKDGKGSYMRKDGHFDRTAFEKFVINPLCDDLAKCEMIKLNILEDGKPYRKIKEHGRVRGYEFSWDVSDRPNVINAAEKKEITAKIEKNPQVLKVAKDILEGQKKQAKKKFGYERKNDYDELEKRMLERSMSMQKKDQD